MRRNFLIATFFHFWPKAMLLLNPFSMRILPKIGIKRKRKMHLLFKRLHVKSQGEFSVKTNIFRKFIQFSEKGGCY